MSSNKKIRITEDTKTVVISKKGIKKIKLDTKMNLTEMKELILSKREEKKDNNK